MMLTKGKGKGEMGNGWLRWFVTMLFAATSPLSLLHSPLSAQGLTDSEIPTPLSERTLSTRFENLGVQQGLTQSTIFDITQDRHGYMWFATYAGINRFDGYEVKQFTHVPFDSTSLGPGWNFELFEDTQGQLWVAQAGGISVMDPVTETFKRYRYDPADSTGLSGNWSSSVFEDRDGTIWVGSWRAGLNRMDTDREGSFTHFRHDKVDSTSLSHPQVHEIFQDVAGYLWISTRRGLNRLDPRDVDSGFRRYLEDEREVWGMYERDEVPGILWVGTASGLLRLDTESGDFERFTPANPELNPGVIAVSHDPTNRNVLWVNFATGVGRFDLRSRQFITYGSDPSNPNNLSGDELMTVFTDRSGIVWVGTGDTGVDRFNPTMVGLAHYKVDPANPISLPGPGVWNILKDRTGILWVATRSATGARLSRIDRATGTAIHFEHDPDDPLSLPGRGGANLYEDQDGTIWVGIFGSGIYTIDSETGRFTYRFSHDPDDPQSLGSNLIQGFIEDRAGQLWVWTNQGLNRRTPGTDSFERYYFGDEGERGPANALMKTIEDQAGYIWSATHKGVYRIIPETGAVTGYLHDESDETSLASDVTFALHERPTEPGIIWIATDMGGLNRLDTETGTIRHFMKKDGLADNVVYDILEDERGRLWMSTNNGLSRFDPETETFRNYGLEIGLQGLEFNGTAAFRADDGEMFFGGNNGLNAFYPNEIFENNEAPEVLIVDLKLSNRSVRETGALGLKTALEETKEIRLTPDQKDLQIDFVAVHYQNPELNEFAYKLEGFNEDWIEAGRKRSATYTNLDPGTYTFRVKAANSDGIWNEEGTSLTIVVEPPIWATWWFRLFGALIFGGAIYGAYRYRTQQLEDRARHLEETVERRTSQLTESNEQLEQSHTIVEAINRETSFRRLLTKILDEARVIPGVEKATALVYMHDDERFHVRASSGWDVDAMQGIRLTRREAHDRYVKQAEEVADDIFAAKNVADREGSDQMAEFGQVASFLVLRVEVDGETTGYLVFDNMTDPDAFDQRDVDLLTRLREHIQSAFIKTRILEDLQTTLNDLQSTQDRLVQSEKMASLGQLTAGIAHEIKNPLNFVNNFSEVTAELATELASEIAKVKDKLPAENLAEVESILESLTINAGKIGDYGKRADGIVQNMLEHSKTGEGQRTPTDLNDFLGEYITLAHHAAKAGDSNFDVHIEREFDDAVGMVDLVPQEMGRVFMNLIGNAVDALRANGEWRMENGEVPAITVSTSKFDGPDFAGIEIRIADNGPGIPEKVKARIFEPFFTTKPAGSGTGLGLSMSYDIVTKGHGGSLHVESVEGHGATFIISLPV